MRPDNRRTYFIKKDFQLRFILRFVLVTTVWAGATVLLFELLALKRMEQAHLSPAVNAASADLLLPVTFAAHLFSLAVFASILAYTVRSLWRRLAEPLAKIKSELARIAAGELARPVTLRKSDEFQDLASDVDSMRRALRDKVVLLKQGGLALAVASSQLNRALDENKAAPAHAEALRALVEKMKKDVRAFRS
ncbi:MAG TPA: HAMP domain-containing protein [Nitrospirota bacterium]|nr:HAMP domain-containing protein [Nitrospirota bacterium]